MQPPARCMVCYLGVGVIMSIHLAVLNSMYVVWAWNDAWHVTYVFGSRFLVRHHAGMYGSIRGRGRGCESLGVILMHTMLCRMSGSYGNKV